MSDTKTEDPSGPARITRRFSPSSGRLSDWETAGSETQCDCLVGNPTLTLSAQTFQQTARQDKCALSPSGT